MSQHQNDGIDQEVAGTSHAVTLIKHRAPKQRPFLLALLVFAIGIACGAIALKSLPVQAAIQIEYFNAVTIDDYLRLEWRTAVENDLALIEVYCKEENESNSAYHLIGSRIAQGNKEAGADYAMNLSSGIEPNTTYCFRLKEITTDGRKGDLLDYCGYGLNITPFDEVQIVEVTAEPTPLLVPFMTEAVDSSLPPTITVLITPTATITAMVPSATITAMVPSSTPTLVEDEPIIVINTPATVATNVAIATATETATMTTTTTPTTFTPTITPTNDAAPSEDPSDDEIIIVVPTERATAVQSATTTPASTPAETPIVTPTTMAATQDLTITPEIMFTPTITVTPLATMTPAITQTMMPTSAFALSAQTSPLPSPMAPSTSTDSSNIDSPDNNGSTVDTIGQAGTQAEMTSTESDLSGTQGLADNPPYIILTATPVVTPMGIEPTFTPFPTSIAKTEENPVLAALPTQNLMILLLCGVFSGASGLGILGLVTTLLYMRSRTIERQDNQTDR